MRDEKPADFMAALFKIASVWQDVIDTWRFVFAELETAIENENIIADFNRSHVAADFFDSAERNDAYGINPRWRDARLDCA